MTGSFVRARRLRRIALIGGAFGGVFLAGLMAVVSAVINSEIICFSSIGIFVVCLVGGVIAAVSLQQKQGSYALREVAEQLGLSTVGNDLEGTVQGAPVRVSAYMHTPSSRTRETRLVARVFHPRELGLDLSIRGRLMMNRPRPGAQEARLGHPELDLWLYADCVDPQQARALLAPAAVQAMHGLVSWSRGRAWFELDDHLPQLDFHLDDAAPEQVAEGVRRLIALRYALFWAGQAAQHV